jgi:hypothetical protein
MNSTPAVVDAQEEINSASYLIADDGILMHSVSLSQQQPSRRPLLGTPLEHVALMVAALPKQAVDKGQNLGVSC